MHVPLMRTTVRSGLPLWRPWPYARRVAGAAAAAAGLTTSTCIGTCAGARTRRRRESPCSSLLYGRFQRRASHDDAASAAASSQPGQGRGKLDEFKSYFDFPRGGALSNAKVGDVVTLQGSLSKRRDMSSSLSFVDLIVDDRSKVQFKSSWKTQDSPEHELHKALKAVPSWSAVSLTGKLESRDSSRLPVRTELSLQAVQILNPFPKNIIVSNGALYPPHARHLQLKFDEALRTRIALRSLFTIQAQYFLQNRQFHLVETPVLFKSTPEGAREFLVPTRRSGYAYALPQSPQQYKQILMASGVRRYFQFARCFRDEDLRADRQPEFTQLDLEMAFAKGEDVMAIVEDLICTMEGWLRDESLRVRQAGGERWPVFCASDSETQPYPEIIPKGNHGEPLPFPRLTYDQAMSQYGSDKPDLRAPNKIHRIDHLIPQTFTSMITDLEDPIVEACVFRFDGPPQDFIKSVWDNLPKRLRTNRDGQPVPLIINSSKPLFGLSTLGHEAVDPVCRHLEASQPDLVELQEGDVIIIQARPKKPFSGGSTSLGTLRKHIYDEAVAKSLLRFDPTFKFLWVTGFPLFTANDATSTGPGQGGAAGFSSTHHPFTAPLGPEDFDLLATDPLRAKADHYDLVVNGVELGGGSRRVHVAAVQEYIFRDVLQMSATGVEQFRHLLEALRAGCPPHAGFAIGWDRLIATLTYTSSVRDVIVFPKSKKGDEPVSNSPGRVSDEDWAVYRLKQKKDE